MNDLFARDLPQASADYSARDIEVLEGLEPVRRRPGMFIGGTDERALHHLVAELLDNAMDEAVAGHATRIEIELHADGRVTVRDNGRGIPIDPHPKFPDKSALEVILTTLHSGGKFGGKVYRTAGGLHGVGLSVVNALAAELCVEVARQRQLFVQRYRQGRPLGPLESAGAAPNRRGTTVSFRPDPSIFEPGARFRPALLHRMARSKAYLFRGVEIRWACAPELVQGSDVPERDSFHFPNGLLDFLAAMLDGRATVTETAFAGEAELADGQGRVEWAVAWPVDEEGYQGLYCNTIPTPEGGSHEQGLRGALLRGLKDHAERLGQRRAAQLTAEDVQGGACLLLSLFVKEPQFQGQTKERLALPGVVRPLETALKDRFDLWLSAAGRAAEALLDHVCARAEERIARRKQKETVRKSATRKLRLPGKLADCALETREGTELFIVEGDSAGGSAKQARERRTQAILPLRGKILNAASASSEKLQANRELADLVTALGCGHGKALRLDELRYEKVIVMTDADVDGAHIAALLMTFFFREMRPLVTAGHLYLARPPLFRLAAGGLVLYADSEEERDALIARRFKGRKVEVGRFKGLGEMNPRQLRETTMDPATRTLYRVAIGPDERPVARLVDELMGRKPELRLAYIQEHAPRVQELDI